MKLTKEGRVMLENVQDNLDIDSYAVKFEDVGRQAKAYVSEMSDFIDVAQKENRRILGSKTLI